MYINVIKKLNQLEDEYIIVGVSAGPDSMALLHMLQTYCQKSLVCAHINHNVRSNSVKEEKYLKDYCDKHSIYFESITINNYTENNFENEARKKRYQFYEQTLKKYHSHTLVLAHHGDDLIETILMRIGRGSNLKGYAGFSIESERHEYKLLKPLIYYTKSEIMLYLDKYSIPYVLDNTNLEDNYTRNRYRHNVLPFLK